MYQNHFGFRKFPFAFGSDPGVYYCSSRIRKLYEGLVQGIRSGKPLLMLIGEEGAGKTILIRRIAADLDSRYQVHFCRKRYLVFADLIIDFCEQLNFGYECREIERSNQIELLSDYLVEERQKGRHHVFVVDPITNTTPDLLIDLLSVSKNFANNVSVLQTVYLGLPALEQMIATPHFSQLKTDSVPRYRIDTLNTDEIEEYINFHLRMVGSKQKDLFSKEAIRQIAIYSHGNPRIINSLCGFTLLSTFLDGKKTITSETVDDVATNTICEKKNPANRLSQATDGCSHGTRRRQTELSAAENEELVSFNFSADPVAKESYAALASRRYDELGIPRPDPITLPSEPPKAGHPRKYTGSIPPTRGRTHPPGIVLLSIFVLSVLAAGYYSILSSPMEPKKSAMTSLEVASPPLHEMQPEPADEFLQVSSDFDKDSVKIATDSANLAYAESRDGAIQPRARKSVQELEAASHDTIDEKAAENDRTDKSSNRWLEKALLKAKTQMKAQRLTTPPGNNAYETYRKVLTSYPDHREASYGIFKIKRTYQRWGLDAEQRGDLGKAKRYYSRALRVAPEDKVVATALEHVKQKLMLEWKYNYRVME